MIDRQFEVEFMVMQSISKDMNWRSPEVMELGEGR
jgi:hypothetical protein